MALVGQANPDPAAREYNLAAGHALRLDDVLLAEFGSDGKAALRMTPSAGAVVATDRTYNLLAAGDALGLPPGATFGQYIPAVRGADAIGFGDEGRLIQLSHTASGGGFRTNLGLVNLTGAATTVTIDLFEADGSRLGAVSRTLAPYEYRQLGNVFASVSSSEVADGYLEVGTATDGGAFFALASVVDNRTGDPVGMLHARVVAPGAQGFVEGTSALFGVLGGTVGELVGPPDVVELIQTEGVNSLLLDAAAWVPIATVSGGVLSADFGTGWTDPGGALHTGGMELDLSGLAVTASSITGALMERHTDHLIDGEPPVIGWIEAELDLAVDAQGEIQGTIDVSGGSPAGAFGKSTGAAALSGTIEIDTILCRFFPTGGTVTFALGDSSTTITFTPACDGAFDYSSDPRWDWLYQARDPEDADSQTYIHNTSNAVIRTEGQFRFCQPDVGGQTFATTTPGTVIYRFPFDRPVLAAQGSFSVYTFHWSYSQGHGFISGSADGAHWVLLDEVQPPAEGAWNRGGTNIVVPPGLLGGTELWFKIELYAYGPSAPNGGALTNTAQLCRPDVDRDPVTAWLQVDME